MSSALHSAIANLSSSDAKMRETAARELYTEGRDLAKRAVSSWWTNSELASLLFSPNPHITVGLAVPPNQFDAIHAAHGSPRLAQVPPDQDAKEFELHFADGVAIDMLTSKDPVGSGVIARYLARFGQGIQQVEFRCQNLERATEILRENFGVAPVYPAKRPGADGTRINFFLVGVPEGGKVLIELYEPSEPSH